MNRLLIIAALPFTAVACGKDAAAPKVIVPSLSIVAGQAQTDTVGKTLPVQLGAKLTDAATGLPLPGRVLNWVVVSGGGQVFAAVTQTGSDGLGKNSWTLGTSAGGQKVVARYIDPETGAPVTLDTANATAIPGPPTRFSLPGAQDTSIARSQLPNDSDVLFEYELRDQFGNISWNCAGKSSPAAWTWTFNSVGTTVPNPPLLTARDTVVVIGERRFALLNLHASAQPTTWTGTQVNITTTGCAAIADSVFLHYDHVR